LINFLCLRLCLYVIYILLFIFNYYLLLYIKLVVVEGKKTAEKCIKESHKPLIYKDLRPVDNLWITCEYTVDNLSSPVDNFF